MDSQRPSDRVPHILIFIDWYEPAFRAGGPVRSVVNLVSRLSGRYRFSVIASAFDYGNPQAMAQVPHDQWVERQHGEKVKYCSKLGFRACYQAIRDADCDRVYIQSMFSPRYGIFPLLAARLLGKKVIVAPRGMLHPTALAIKRQRKIAFLRIVRFLGLYRSVVFQAVDNWEADFVKEQFPRNRVFRATNMAALPGQRDPAERKYPDTLRLVSVARISPEKNNLFLLRILSQLPFPVEADIYGAPGSDQKYVAQFKLALQQLPPHVQVRWDGFLSPEELSEKLQQADWFALSTLGENFGHAIFEAMANGLPVIIGDNTPWKGLAAIGAGFDLPARDEQAWLQAFESAFRTDAVVYAGMSAAALQLVRTTAGSDTSYDQYRELFEA
jgi:glycosyltransferase involved in cell wall biosynthesis